MNDLGILILAGGEATRLPGKLALSAGDLPLIARVYRNMSAHVDASTFSSDARAHTRTDERVREDDANDDRSRRDDSQRRRPRLAEPTYREIVISGKASFAPELDALLPATLVIDRWSMRGPLAGMLSSMAQMRSRFVFAVAGDAPFVEATLIERLARDYRVGDEALVPVHRDARGVEGVEPLAAIYDRLTFLRAGMPVLRAGRGKLRLVIDAMRARFVALDDATIFANVNTLEDYAAVRARLESKR